GGAASRGWVGHVFALDCLTSGNFRRARGGPGKLGKGRGVQAEGSRLHGELVLVASDQTVNGLGLFLDLGLDLERHWGSNSCHERPVPAMPLESHSRGRVAIPLDRWARPVEKVAHRCIAGVALQPQDGVNGQELTERGERPGLARSSPALPASPDRIALGDWLSGRLFHGNTVPPYAVWVDSRALSMAMDRSRAFEKSGAISRAWPTASLARSHSRRR